MAAKKATRKATGTKSAKKTAKTSAKKSAAVVGGGRITGLKKADGEAPVRAYLAKIPPAHRAIGEAIDEIVAKNVPGVRRAIKWSTPMYGLEGRGWFMAFGSFKSYAKVNFFMGAHLKPVPPEGEGKDMRSINVPSLADLDQAQMTAWVKQAAAIPGWGS
ncbi:MAG TPA: DUF1801 domain-containing protein [Candidatus Thermoplasmatota archaeon]|nr:DUF1801 domain-containing protein [Candidatus Thermoplasmatota archaeon]